MPIHRKRFRIEEAFVGDMPLTEIVSGGGGEIGVSLSRRVGIESDGKVGGLLVADDFEKGLRKAVKGGSIDPFRRENRARDERKVRPINQRHAVQEEKLFRHGKTIARYGWRITLDDSGGVGA